MKNADQQRSQTNVQRQTTRPSKSSGDGRSSLRSSLRGTDFEGGSAMLSPSNQVQMHEGGGDGQGVPAAIFQETWGVLRHAGRKKDPQASIGLLGEIPALRARAQADGDRGARSALRRLDRWQRVVTTVTLPEAEGLTELHGKVLESAWETGRLRDQVRGHQRNVDRLENYRDEESRDERRAEKSQLAQAKKQHKRTKREGRQLGHAFYVANKAYEEAVAKTGVKDLEALAEEAWDNAGAFEITGGDLGEQLPKVRSAVLLPDERRLKQAYKGNDEIDRDFVERETLSERYEDSHGYGELASPGTRRAMVGNIAQNACDFTGAQVEPLKSGGNVWRVTLPSDDKVVVKQQDGDDRMYADLANVSGLRAPETRELEAGEIRALKEAGIAQVARGWVVMNHVDGQNLIEKTMDEDADLDDGFSFLNAGKGQEETLTTKQVEVMGRSIAFQLLMRGWDRWELPVGPEKGNYNLENIMISRADGTGEERVALIDNTGTAHRGKAREWQQKIDGYVDEVIAEGDGGTLIAMAARRLKQASYKIGETEKQHLRQGFINFLVHLRKVDLGAVVQRSDRDATIVEFCSEMQTYFLGKVDEMAQRIEGENAHKTKLLGYLNRYATEKKGLKSKRERMKARIKKMKRGMGKEEGARFAEWARHEMDGAMPSKKKGTNR